MRRSKGSYSRACNSGFSSWPKGSMQYNRAFALPRRPAASSTELLPCQEHNSTITRSPNGSLDLAISKSPLASASVSQPGILLATLTQRHPSGYISLRRFLWVFIDFPGDVERFSRLPAHDILTQAPQSRSPIARVLNSLV